MSPHPLPPELRSPIPYGTLVSVVWRDSVTHAGWHGDPEHLEPLMVRTCGYFVGIDASTLRLACSMTTGEDPQVADVSAIPLCCLISAEVPA